jgi:YHS domain-containing protein
MRALPRLLPLTLLPLATIGCSPAPSADIAPSVGTAAAPSGGEAPSASSTRPAWPSAGPAWAAVPLAEGAVSTARAATEVPPTFRNGAGKVACPVMGMAIARPEDAVSYADHDGVRYFFCCDSCEKLFLGAPSTYADGAYLAAHDLDPTAAAACAEEGGS